MKPGSYVPKFLLRSEMPVVAQPAIVADHHQAMHAQVTQSASVEAMKESTTSTDQQAATESQNPAHLSVNQQANGQQDQPLSDTANSSANDEQEDRNASINQLWQTYKSSSKVA